MKRRPKKRGTARPTAANWARALRLLAAHQARHQGAWAVVEGIPLTNPLSPGQPLVWIKKGHLRILYC